MFSSPKWSEKTLGILNIANDKNIPASVVYQNTGVLVKFGNVEKTIPYTVFEDLEPVEILEHVTGDKSWQKGIHDPKHRLQR